MAASTTKSDEASGNEPRSCQDYHGQSFDISSAAYTLASLFPENVGVVQKLSDRAIYEVSNLLRAQGMPSANPRLYIVLRFIGHLNALQAFTDRGITDFWFPFQTTSLPPNLPPAVRSEFLKRQWVVLTKSMRLEKGSESDHQYFGPDDVVPFESQGRLGEGTYGAVDQVRSTVSGNVYARKRLRRSERRNIQRNMGVFEKEISALKRLQHRHIVKLVGSYTDPVFAACIMSPIAEMNLEQFMAGAAVDPNSHRRSVLRKFFGCLTNGLEYMHRQSVRHKDIKPSNILVKGGSVLFTDFGLALDWTEAGFSTTQDTSPGMTRTYSAPELHMDAPRNSKTDVWSLGCVFVEMISVLEGWSVSELREYLFKYGTRTSVYALNIDGVETFLNQLESELGDSSHGVIFSWIRTMLEKTPARRAKAKSLFQMIERADSFMGECCKSLQSRNNPEEQSLLERDEEIEVDHDCTEGPLLVATSGSSSAFSGPEAALLHSEDVEPIQANGEMTSVMTDPSPRLLKRKAFDDPSTHASLERKRCSGLSSSPGMSTARERTKKTGPPSKRALKTHIFAAVLKGDLTKVQAALDRGADIDALDYFGNTPLQKAVMQKDGAMISLLVEKGANLGIQDRLGFTALHMAAEASNSDAIEILLAAGVEVDIKTFENHLQITPLCIAADEGDLHCATKLVNAGADVGMPCSTGSTPLSISAVHGNKEATQFLLIRGADANGKLNNGLTSLHLAARGGHAGVVQILIDHGAEIEAKEDERKQTPLHAAALRGQSECVRALLESGAAVDSATCEDSTALKLAAMNGQVSTIEVLLDHGASFEADASKHSVIHTAVYYGHIEVVNVLCQRGTAFQGPQAKDRRGNTPLMMAAMRNHDHVVSYLLGLNVNLEERNRSGWTALHWSAKHGCLGCVDLLLQHGSDPTSLTSAGATPLDLAISEGHIEVSDLLDDLTPD